MTKRYRLSIGSSILLHAVLIAVFFRMKIPVMKYNEKTQFSIVFSDINTVIKPSFPGDLSANHRISTGKKSTKAEGEGTIGRLQIPPLTRTSINKTVLQNSGINTGPDIPEKFNSNIRRVSPARKVLIPESSIEDILKEIGGLSGSKGSNRDIKTQENRDNRIKWNHSGRRILKSKSIVFPDVLKVEGQDATVKAKIFVNPEGNVRKVVIIKSSGYIEVDSVVAASLRQYLFNPSENGEEDIGIIEIHFKLKRED